MWVKICANTNLEDALAAVQAGADALGFVFAPSPRRISPRHAAPIIGKLPDKIEKIGVFVNQAPKLILDTAEKAGLTGVQLHGDEDPRVVAELLRQGLAVYKTIRMRELARADNYQLAAWRDSGIAALLIDSGTRRRRGGTGKAFSWHAAAPVLRLVARRMKIVIAGGLGPANVAEAIETLRPWGVDVVSGVESAPGKKDHQKLRAFVRQAKHSKFKIQRPKIL